MSERCPVPRLRRFGRVLGVVLFLAAGVVGAFRVRPPALMRFVRAVNRRILNPLILPLAGRRWWYASLVRHVGRRTGASHATPVLAERAGRFLFIPLPYGLEVDWCRNVLLARSAEVVSKGIRYRTVSPQVVPASEAAPRLRSRWRALLALFAVRDYLRLEIVEERPRTGVSMTAGASHR
jgi:hypothetical protein